MEVVAVAAVVALAVPAAPVAASTLVPVPAPTLDHHPATFHLLPLQPPFRHHKSLLDLEPLLAQQDLVPIPDHKERVDTATTLFVSRLLTTAHSVMVPSSTLPVFATLFVLGKFDTSKII